MNNINDFFEAMPSLLTYIVVSVILLLGSYWVLDLLTPGKLTRIIKEGGWNGALIASAELFAVAFIIMFAMLGQPVTWGGIITATVFAVAGVLFQLLGTWVIKITWFRNTDVEQLLKDRVSPAGMFFASYCLALGLVMGIAVH